MPDGGFIHSSPKREYTGIQTIRSISAKQINNIDQDESSTVAFLDGVELTSIQLIGWITEIKGTNTGKSFTLEDGTSTVDCTLWPNKPHEEHMASLIEEGECIKVTGVLKTYSGRRCIQITNLHLVEDYNELTFHYLQIVKQHLHFTKKILNVQTKSLNLNNLQNEILTVLKNNQDENGLEYELILKCLEDSYSERIINENLEMLVENCFVVKKGEGVYKAI
uniref:WD repeat-containing protein n=1 Tax=Nosema pernyi TaxID=1112939 RepID=A0A0N7ABW0_9MICR|nr:WD repeat-containing protein [Nosema pernyi]